MLKREAQTRLRIDHGNIPSHVLLRNWDGEDVVGDRVTKFNDGRDPRWAVRIMGWDGTIKVQVRPAPAHEKTDNGGCFLLLYE